MIEEYDFTEIFKLREMLDKSNIEYEFIDHSFKNGEYNYTSYQIVCPNDENRYISVIQSFGSYGREQDLLEIMGLLTKRELKDDTVVGHLTADNVFKRIKKQLKIQNKFDSAKYEVK
jgi:hypothetical protein